MAIHHDLALITSTRVDLVELARSDAVRSSPFFNIFATINIEPFSRNDVGEMLQGYLADSEISVGDEEIDQLLVLAGRVPFFVQMAFHFMVEAHQSDVEKARLPAYVEERLQDAASPHLDNYWQNSSENERMVLALMTLHEGGGEGGLRSWQAADLEQWHIHAGVTLNQLANRGLVIRDNDSYALSSSILRRWVVGEITPAAEDVDGAEELQRLESQITTSLPQEVATGAVQWLRRTNTKYRALFARWLSFSRTCERVLELLSATTVPFQELRGEAPAPAAPAPGLQGLDALPDLTEAEKSRAQQLANIEGTVSILFTDLEGSTELLNSLGDEENHEVIRKHNAIIREQISNHSGIEVKNMGDGFMVVFSSVRRAVTCAADIQRSLGQYTEDNPDRPLRVRIGINVGEAIKEEEDFFGTAVVLAARIMGKAIGGQILVSDLFRRMAGTASGYKYSDQGWTQLKEFSDEEHLYEVDWRESGG